MTDGHVGSYTTKNGIVAFPGLGQGLLNVIYPLPIQNVFHNDRRKHFWRVTLAEFNNLLGNQSQMTHIPESNFFRSLSFVTPLLALEDGLGDVSCFEKIDRYGSIVSTFHRPVEDLLNNIVHNVVEEVVPWETEKEILSTNQQKLKNDLNRYPPK